MKLIGKKMEKTRIKKIKKKSQSIIEYLIVIGAVTGFIVAGTIGVRRGVKTGLNRAKAKIKADLDTSYEGEVVDFGEE